MEVETQKAAAGEVYDFLWNGTPSVLEYFYQVISASHNPAKQIEQLQEFIDSPRDDLFKTTESQGSLSESILERIQKSASTKQPPTRLDLPASTTPGDRFILDYQTEYTICTMSSSDNELLISHDQAWQFIAGMMQKSLNEYDDIPEPEASRYSTEEFEKALSVFQAPLLHQQRQLVLTALKGTMFRMHSGVSNLIDSLSVDAKK